MDVSFDMKKVVVFYSIVFLLLGNSFFESGHHEHHHDHPTELTDCQDCSKFDTTKKILVGTNDAVFILQIHSITNSERSNALFYQEIYKDHSRAPPIS